jgi:hypothetical protein
MLKLGELKSSEVRQGLSYRRGWYQSVLASAHEVSHSSSNRLESGSFAWDSYFLMYSVWEPFPSNQTWGSLVHGQVNYDNPLSIESLMTGNGVIFSDGIESDYLPFNSAALVVPIAIAEKRSRLVV